MLAAPRALHALACTSYLSLERGRLFYSCRPGSIHTINLRLHARLTSPLAKNSSANTRDAEREADGPLYATARGATAALSVSAALAPLAALPAYLTTAPSQAGSATSTAAAAAADATVDEEIIRIASTATGTAAATAATADGSAEGGAAREGSQQGVVPPIRHLLCEGDTLLFALRDRLYAYSRTAGAVTATFRHFEPRDRWAETETTDRGEAVAASPASAGAVSLSDSSPTVSQDEQVSPPRTQKSALSSPVSRGNTPLSASETPRGPSAVSALRSTPLARRTDTSPKSSSKDRGGARAETLHVCGVSVAGDTLLVQYPRIVYVMDREALGHTPLRVLRVVHLHRDAAAVVDFGPHFFVLERPHLYPPDGLGGSPPTEQRVHLLANSAAGDKQATATATVQTMTLPTHAGPAVAHAAGFALQSEETEGYNAFASTHVFIATARCLLVVRVARPSEQVALLTQHGHFATAQHLCQQRHRRPRVLVEVSNAYACQLWHLVRLVHRDNPDESLSAKKEALKDKHREDNAAPCQGSFRKVSSRD